MVVRGAVGPGLNPKSSPPIISVRPSSCVTVNCWPFVTETFPTKLTNVPVVKLSMRLESVPGVFSTMLNAPLLASHVLIVAFSAEKLKGEFTLKVTSAVPAGTFPGIASCEVASGTR